MTFSFLKIYSICLNGAKCGAGKQYLCLSHKPRFYDSAEYCNFMAQSFTLRQYLSLPLLHTCTHRNGSSITTINFLTIRKKWLPFYKNNAKSAISGHYLFEIESEAFVYALEMCENALKVDSRVPFSKTSTHDSGTGLGYSYKESTRGHPSLLGPSPLVPEGPPKVMPPKIGFMLAQTRFSEELLPVFHFNIL